MDFWAELSADREDGFDALRDAGRVVELDGVYNLTRRDDVLAAWNNPDVFSCALRPWPRAFDVAGLPPAPSLFDAPEHTRYRSVLQPCFSPHVLTQLAPALAGLAAALIETVAANGCCDAMGAVAHPFAAGAILALYGLPLADRDRLSGWKHAITGALPVDPSTGWDGLFAYLADAIGQRPKSGLLAGLATLSDAEALGMAALAADVGMVPLAAGIGFALLALASDPQLCHLLSADPHQVKVFVDEILRLETANNHQRVTTESVTIGDATIPAGSLVNPRVGCVNREASNHISVCGNQLVPQRHYTFGVGIHRCPAAQFVRMGLTLLIREWLRRVPDFGLAPGAGVALASAVVSWELYSPIQSFTLPALALRWKT